MTAPRDDKGRFIKGHSGNPGGRPINQTKYLKKLDTAMKITDWREIVEKAIEQAKRGDSRAREWLSSYLMGKPTQPMDITSDGERIGNPVPLDKATDEQLRGIEEILKQLSEPADGRTE